MTTYSKSCGHDIVTDKPVARFIDDFSTELKFDGSIDNDFGLTLNLRGCHNSLRVTQKLDCHGPCKNLQQNDSSDIKHTINDFPSNLHSDGKMLKIMKYGYLYFLAIYGYQ